MQGKFEVIGSSSTKLLLLTGNVGSAFEDPTKLLKVWIQTLLEKICETEPQFIALHLQEVGGKYFEKSMKYTRNFVKQLTESDILMEYSRYKIFMDEDFSSLENFTALGNLYFAHNSIESLKIWNFSTHKWETALDKDIYFGNIESIKTKEKSKFPIDFFPQFKFSRKGFMRTRWEINSTSIDLVNIHLFHDVSNLEACEDNMSIYSKARRRALLYSLERFQADINYSDVPYIVFGDFNFRCDTKGVIMKLTNNLEHHRYQSTEPDKTKVSYYSSHGENVLTIGKKEFKHCGHQTTFKMPWLKNYDKEIDALEEILFEYPIEFSPSYPYEENLLKPCDFMLTRCPAWCDRVLLSMSSKNILNEKKWLYQALGEEVCMGDHKPIYLYVDLKNNQDKINRSNVNHKNKKLISNNSSKYQVPAISLTVKNLCGVENQNYKISYIFIDPFSWEYDHRTLKETCLNDRSQFSENINFFSKTILREASF